MLRHLFVATMTISILAGCSSGKKIIKFATVPNEEYANPTLKAFFKNNRNPNIVLRVPNNNDKATSNTSTNKNNDVLYNTIEKELLKENFSVRDRGLFNELLSKSSTSDYSKIKELTNTDIILEVVNIDPSVLYTTNKVTTVTAKKETENIGSVDYKEKGASVEYKVILVKNNEIAGTYKFNYKPCPDGCELITFKFTGKRSSLKPVLRETVEINTMEEFLKSTTRQLIASFRQ
ncbi:MAG: hypothetical protein IPM72_11505 [Chitinophagaceae bacterium]|nr:hypothetical protein [Chitinophagaceae bacterium]